MMGTKDPHRIPLPKSRNKHVRVAMLHVLALARYATAYTRGWASNSLNDRHDYQFAIDTSTVEKFSYARVYK